MLTIIDSDAQPAHLASWAKRCASAPTGRVRRVSATTLVVFSGASWTPAKEKAALDALR